MAQHDTGGAAAASAGTTGPTSTADAKTSMSGGTGSATEVAPGVIVSSSGGSHTTPTTRQASLPDETAVPRDPDSESPTRTEPAASPKNTSTHAPTKNTGAPARQRTPAEQRRAATRTAPAVQAVSPAGPTNAAAVTTTAAPAIATTATASTATAPAPAARIGTPTAGVIGFLNGIVTKLLNPFLAPPPATPNPFTPAVWAVLGWVRRSLFNQSPTITYNPATTVRSGQTVTGNIGATDPEGDRLTYMIKKQPRLGTLTIDQATGAFTYTPSDPNLSGPLVDSFTVRVSDGKLNLLDLWRPHADQVTIGVSLLTPATVGVDFGSNQGWLLHTEAYNNFHVSSTFAGQRPEDVDFLNEIGLHGALYRVWLNSPNQTDPVCTTSSGTCTLSPGFDAYLSDIDKVSDAQIANLRLDAWIGQDAATARPQIERMLLAIKQAHPEIQYIEAWNEPDAPGTKILPAQVYQGYVPLYQAVNNINAALGATAGYVPLKVGGPALYYFNTSLLSTFLDAYVADPDPNKRLDFVSYHAYVNILPDGTRQFLARRPSAPRSTWRNCPTVSGTGISP